MKKFFFLLCLLSMLQIHADVITNENFESGAAGWNNTTREYVNGTYFLGRFAGTGGAQGIYKSYSLNAGLKSIRIQFDFYEFDSWDGESFYIYINDSLYQSNPFWTNSHYSNEDKPANAINLTPGTTNIGFGTWADEFFRYTIDLTNTSITTLKLGFGCSLDQDISDESWGVDNVFIEATYAVPEPATFVLGFLSILSLIFFVRCR